MLPNAVKGLLEEPFNSNIRVNKSTFLMRQVVQNKTGRDLPKHKEKQPTQFCLWWIPFNFLALNDVSKP